MVSDFEPYRCWVGGKKAAKQRKSLTIICITNKFDMVDLIYSTPLESADLENIRDNPNPLPTPATSSLCTNWRKNRRILIA
jgi:hypothetical protein